MRGLSFIPIGFYVGVQSGLQALSDPRRTLVDNTSESRPTPTYFSVPLRDRDRLRQRCGYPSTVRDPQRRPVRAIRTVVMRRGWTAAIRVVRPVAVEIPRIVGDRSEARRLGAET